MNYYFDEIFVLSPLLKAYENRDTLFEYQMQQLKIRYRKHTGINHYNLIKNYEFKHKFRMKNDIHTSLPNNWSSRDVAASVTQGHLDIISYAQQANMNNVLIFENDVLFREDAKNIFDNLIVGLPSDWDILYLGALYNYDGYQTIYESKYRGMDMKLIKLNNDSLCAHAYALSKKAIVKCLGEFERLVGVDDKFFIIDQFLGHMTLNVGLNTYAMLPKLCEQGDMQTPYLSGNEELVESKLDIPNVHVREPNFEKNKYYDFVQKEDYIKIISPLNPNQPNNQNRENDIVNNIIEKAKNNILVSEDIYKQRMSICSTCDFYKKGICKRCGCNMQTKNYMKGTTCPEKKF